MFLVGVIVGAAATVGALIVAAILIGDELEEEVNSNLEDAWDIKWFNGSPVSGL